MCYTFRVPEKRNGRKFITHHGLRQTAQNQETEMDREAYDKFYDFCEKAVSIIFLVGWAMTIILGSL